MKYLRALLPLLTVGLLCAVAVAPLLQGVSPCTHDGAFHYYRVAAMRHALREGILFTRYLPDLAFGYGYPFFNYRAALSYYLALALHLTGLALPLALNLVYVLSIVGSAIAAYLLARDLFGPWAGIVAATAYAYAPYQFLNALLRANAPESLALPLMPLILWAFRRLALTGRRRWFLVSVASLVALYLTHNISSLLFTPFLLAYLAMLWLVHRRDGDWIAASGALVLALALTAFFLGPALLEQGYAQLHMSRVTRNNDFHYNFLPLAEIFAPPQPVDTSLLNPPMRIHLGLVQAILGGIGTILGLIRWRGPEHRERRATVTFLALSTVGLLWMSTRASLWLWENVPLLPFVQFPWRLVGRAILPLSLLAGATFSPLVPSSSRLRRFPLLPIAAVTLLILAALPDTYPPRGYCPTASNPTIADVFAYEHHSRLVGVDPEGSYFPVWVERRPEDGSPLEEEYADGGPIARFDESRLPPKAAILQADYGPNRARITVETPTPFRARYLAFYFPGWRVTVDGDPVEIQPTTPDGLIAFDLPAGTHIVTVRFGSTPLRTALTLLSLASLGVLFILIMRYPNRGRPHPPGPRPLPTPGLTAVVAVVTVAVALLAFKLAVVDRTTTPFRRPTLRPDGTLPGLPHPLDRPYADGLTLIGYRQEHVTIPTDDELPIHLYWTTHAPPTARYQSVIHLVGADGIRWSRPDTARPRGYANYPPQPSWSPGHYALDSHLVIPLPGTPPGDYDVVLTTFDRATLAPLSWLDERGQPAAPELTLGQVTLTRPRHPVQVSEANENWVGISGAELTLLTAGFDRAQAAPGDTVHLTVMWQADRDGTPCDWQMTLLAPDGTTAAAYELPASAFSWREGDIWRSQHRLTLPATLASGPHTWRVEACAPTGEPVGQITIAAPAHTFTPPPTDLALDVPLGDVATLAGATLTPADRVLSPGSPLTLTLAWRAESTPAAAYHVFLHLLDPTGRIVAQSDGLPAGWTRPTTGWLPGEFILDEHTLSIPPDLTPGDYTLSTGLYLPGGDRLTAPDGQDAILITTIQVAAP